MNIMNKVKNLLIAYVILICFNVVGCGNLITVETELGSIKGTVIEVNNKTLNQFLGIPYALPPIDSNRFDKPEPIIKWNKTLDATKPKNICWQTPAVVTKYNQSEDCLTLNIWSPNNTSRKQLPVMFWIHGGGFHNGNSYQYNGMFMASLDVVFVSINYRLGAFGFLYGSNSRAPGNVGIYDQILALKWVHNNIDRFDGDPSQITIFGESAGSWSVSALIVSPLSRNLFKRAVMQSGAYFFRNYRNYNSSYHLSIAKNMSESIGCPNDNQWLDCLRKVEPRLLIKQNLFNSLVFNNELLPYKLEDAVEIGKFQSGIEVIAGSTQSEGTSWALSGDFGSHKLNNNSVHITKADLKTQIKSMFSTSSDSFREKVYDFYVSHVNESNQIELRKAYIAIYTDIVIKCPTYYFSKKLTNFSSGNKVYFYELTYNSKLSECGKTEWKGICHGDDITFVFGHPIKDPSIFSETDYRFSLLINQLWTNFAKNGNPLSQSVTNTLGVNVTDWPTFGTTNSTEIMELNPYKFGHLFTDPYHDDCDELWKPYFEIEV